MFFHTIAQIIGRRSMFSGAIEGIGKNQPLARCTEPFAHLVARINRIFIETAGLFGRFNRDSSHAGMALPRVTGDTDQERRCCNFISGARQFAQFDQRCRTDQHKQEKYDPAHHSSSLDWRNRPRASQRAASSRMMGANQSGQVTAESIGGL